MKRPLRTAIWLIVGLAAGVSTVSTEAQNLLVRTVEDRDHVTIMEMGGIYDHQPESNRAYEIAIRQAITQEFLRTHADDYDFLVAFTKFPYELGSDTDGAHVGGRYYGLKNDIHGIGQELFDRSASFGSSGRLQGYIDMGVLSRLSTPTDPGFETTLSILAHEFLHRWGAYVRFRDVDGSLSTALLGRERAHWSFGLRTHNSVQYGNDWRDNGDGSFSSEGRSRAFYSPLDLYLMGILDKTHVPASVLIQHADIDPARLPEVGVTIRGTPRTITIDDIVAAEGERVPSAENAPKRFKMAFVLLVRPGEATDPRDLRTINDIRDAFATRFTILTGGAGIVEVFPEPPPEPIPAPSPIRPPSSGPRTSPLDLVQGLDWLLSRQLSDGAWGDSPATRVRDSVAALDLLKETPSTYLAHQRGLGWLAGLQDRPNVDTVSRRLIALAPQFSALDVAFLTTARNTSGGWGLDGGYQNDPFDTALAVAALPQADSAAAISYLIAAQNSDGGWGIRSDLPSSIAPTLAVIRLGAGHQTTELGAAVDRALAWLRTRQNADGGFGSSPSTVAETAQAVLALVNTDFPRADLARALQYLERGQLSDGSWNESVFDTALAVRALKTGALSNVAVNAGSIAFAPTSPTDGDLTTITARISNGALKDVQNLVVRFFDGDPASGGLPIGSDVQIVSLPGLAEAPVSAPWDTTNRPGSHQIFVVVDPDGLIEEFDEADNQTSSPLTVKAAPVEAELRVRSSDLSLAPATLRSIPQVQTLTARVANLGRTDAVQAAVWLYDGDPASGGTRVGETTVNVPATASATADFALEVTSPRDHRFFVVVDATNQFSEADEGNNQASVVLAVQSAFDFSVSPGTLSLSENPIALGRNLAVGALIANHGTTDAFAVKVRFFIDDPAGPFELGTADVDIPAGQSRPVSIDWRTSRPVADLPVVAQVDPGDRFPETSETNNRASAPLSVLSSTKPNLRVSFQDLSVTAPVNQGGTSTLAIVVRNTGATDAVNVGVAFFDGVPGSGGSAIGATQVVPTLAPGAEIAVSAPWGPIASSGNRLIYAVADPANTVDEFDEQDNTAFITVKVRSLPDLTLSSGAISFTPAFPKQGDAVTVTAAVSNTGEQSATNVRVRFVNGDPAAGGMPVGDENILQIDGFGHSTARIALDGQVQSGIRQIYVQVDPANEVVESNDTNNGASRTLGVQDSSVSFSNLYFSPDGNLVQDSTDFFYRLDGGAARRIAVRARDGKTVRTFELAADTSQAGSVTWDGKAADGRVVPDGDYRFALVGNGDRDLASATTVVDNNSLPITQAIGTDFLLQTNLTCDAKGFRHNTVFNTDVQPFRTAGWLPDDSGLVQWFATEARCASGWYPGNCTYEFVTPLAGVYVSSPDGQTRTRITPDSWTTHPPTTSGTELQSVTVSPDGQQVLVTLRHYNTDPSHGDGPLTYVGPVELWIVNTDGSGLRQVGSTGVAGSSLSATTGVWSPDGSRILVSVWDATNGDQLFALRADGSDRTRVFNLPPGQGNIRAAIWSQDSRRVLYSFTDSSSGTALYRMYAANSDGGDRTFVAGTSYCCLGPTPDIQWMGGDRFVQIVWGMPDPTGVFSYSNHTGAWLFSAMGGAPRLLTNNIVSVGSAVLSPDGRTLAYTDTIGHQSSFDPLPRRVATGIWLVGEEGQPQEVYTPTDLNRGIESLTWVKGGRTLAFVETVGTIFKSCSNEVEYFCGESFKAIGAIDLEASTTALNPISLPINGSLLHPLGCAGCQQLPELLQDGNTLLFSHSADGAQLVAVDVSTGAGSVLLSDQSGLASPRLTPSGRYLLYESGRDSSSPTSPCWKGHHDTWLVGSLLNLTAQVSFQRDRSQITIKGIAEDLNFAQYQLEYAPVGSSLQWSPIGAPGDVPVVNGVLGSWIPPSEGSFYVRLRVDDKAGNTASVRKRITWGLTPTITNVSIAPHVFSPDGNGVRDSVTVDYLVLGPVHLAFAIYDAQNQLVRTITQDHATIGPASIAWDGRNDAGQFVVNGTYRLNVLGYDFFVTADVTPPDIALTVSSSFHTLSNTIQCVPGLAAPTCIAIKEAVVDSPYSLLMGHANDPSLAAWKIEVGDGLNPTDWQLVEEGTNPLQALVAGTGIPKTPREDAVVRRMTQPSDFVGRRFRLTATDRAGNVSVVVADLAPEEVIVHAWDAGPVPTNTVLEQKLGPHTLSVAHTARSLETLRLQYRVKGSAFWLDGPVVSLPRAQLDLAWDTSNLAAGTTHEVRVLGRTPSGTELESNLFTIHSDLFELTGFDDKTSLASGVASIREPLKEIRLVMDVAGDPDIGAEPLLGNPVNFAIRVADDVTLQRCGRRDVPARLKGIGASGAIYYSNKKTVTRFAPGERLCAGPGSGSTLELDVRTLEAAQCEVPSPGRVVIGLKAVVDDESKVKLYMQDVPNGLQRLVEGVTLPFTTELNTGNRPEGTYLVRATADTDAGRIEVTKSFVVDRIAPVARITYPIGNQEICPVKSGNRFVLEIQGEADDANFDRFTLEYGVGDTPSAWVPFPAAGAGTQSTHGVLGSWDITALPKNTYSLRLKVFDKGGNVTCHTIAFSLQGGVSLRNLSTDARLLSPNGDQAFDSVLASYVLDSNALVDARVHRVENGELSDPPVRTLMRGATQLTGSNSFFWDGLGDSGVPVPDGRYAIVVRATDACSIGTEASVQVEVDTTPPETVILSPKSSDVLPVVVEVEGSVTDKNFQGYSVDVGEGDAPISWTRLADGLAPVQAGVIGRWNTQGLAGTHTLRLTARDVAANERIVLMPVTVPERQPLIGDLIARPSIFSPNGDGDSDPTHVQYVTTAGARVVLDVLDATGAILATLADEMSLPAGPHGVWWNGSTGAGVRVPDGNYVLRLTATATADSSRAQTEKTTVTVDVTPPTLALDMPADQSNVKGDVTVIGSIADVNIESYSVSYGASPDGPPTVLDHGTQSRAAFTFGTIKGLTDGTYVVRLEAMDVAHNRASRAFSFVVDSTAPIVDLISPEPGALIGGTNRSVLVRGRIAESHARDWVLRYGGGTDPPAWTTIAAGNTLSGADLEASWDFSDVADGPYVLSLLVTDQSGTSSEARASVTIDTSAPVARIAAPANGGRVTGPFALRGDATDSHFKSAVLALSEGPAATAFQYATLDTFTQPLTDATLHAFATVLPDGTYTARLTVEDQLGLQAQAVQTFVIDTHPPAPPPTLVAALEAGRNARLAWTQPADPDVAGYNVWRNGRKVNAVPLPGLEFLDAALPDGLHRYAVTAVDTSGLDSQPSDEARVQVDLAAPTTKLHLPGNGARVSGIVDIRGTASAPDDFKEYRVFAGKPDASGGLTLVRRSPVATVNGVLAELDTSGLAEESVLTIRLEAEDLAGNVASAEIAVRIDNRAPARPVLLSAVASVRDVTVTWQDTSDTDRRGYLLYVGDVLANVHSIVSNVEPYLLAGTSFVDKGVPDGDYTYFVVAVDTAGNFSEPSNTLVATVETRAPRAAIASPATGSKTDKSATLIATTPDLDVATVQFQMKAAAASVWTNLGAALVGPPYQAVWNPAGLAYGSYQFRAVATDVRANTDTAPPAITIVYQDLTPPTAPVGLTARVIEGVVKLTWQANSESDLGGYRVYRARGSEAATKIATVLPGVTMFDDQNVADGQYTYVVKAADTTGNESVASNGAAVRIYTPVIVVPVVCIAEGRTPVNGTGATRGSTVTLFLDSDQGPVTVGTTNAADDGTFTFEAVLPATGTSLLFAQAVDTEGHTSRRSSTVPVTVSPPPDAPIGLSSTVMANLARAVGVVATASSSFPDYSTSRALDGQLDTSWFTDAYDAKNLGTNPFFEVALPADATVSRVKIFGNREFSEDFDFHEGIVQLFDSAGTVLFDSGPVTLLAPMRDLDLPIPDVAGVRRIRFAATVDEGDDPGFAEFEVIGTFDSGVVTSGAYEVGLTWTATTGPALGYSVYRDGVDVVPSADVTSDGVASASSVISGTYSAQRAADGNPNTFWLPANYTQPLSWWQIDFPQPIPLREVRITWLAPYSARDFDVQGWNDVTWSTLQSFANNTSSQTQVTLTTPAIISKLRIVITRSNQYAPYLAEVAVLRKGFTANPSFVDANVSNGRHTYTIAAINACGVESPGADIVVPVGDVTPPDRPSQLTASVISSAVGLTWTAPADLGVASYNVYRRSGTGEWAKLNQVPVGLTGFNDALVANGAYFYRVTAVDRMGNESAPSNEAAAVVDVAAPATPFGLVALPLPSGGAIDLAWSAPNPSTPPSGYRVFRAHTSGGPYDALDAPAAHTTTYRDAGLTNGVTFFYVVTAFDAAGNESAASNEATATAADTAAPAPPVLLYPTDASRPRALESASTPIAGVTQAGTTVMLLRDGLPLGTASAASEATVDSFRLPSEPVTNCAFNSREALLAVFTIPPGGLRSTLAFTDVFTRVTRHYDELIVNQPRLISFSTGVSKVTFVAYDNTDGRHKLYGFDRETGTTQIVTLPSYPIEQAGSPDGRRAALILDNPNSVNDPVWLADLSTGSVTQVTHEGWTAQLVWSPDGRRLAYVTGVASGQVLRVLDVETGARIDVDASSPNSPSFSPDGARLAFRSDRGWGQDIWVYEFSSGAATQLPSDDPDIVDRQFPVFSPDGASLAYLAWSHSTQTSAILVHRFATGTTTRAASGVPYAAPVWTTTELLVLVYGRDVSRISLPGHFEVANVPLDEGLNLISAVANDSSGNESQPAEPLRLTRDTAGLTDLAVGSALLAYPALPVAGDVVRLMATVENVSGVAAGEFTVAFFDTDPQGNSVLIGSSQRVQSLAPGAQVPVSADWATHGLTGRHRVVVLVDPGNTISEQVEINNSAEQEVVVSATGLPSVRVTTDRASYGADQLVRLSIDAANPGRAGPFTLDASIQDSSGQTVTAVAHESLPAFGYAARTSNATWPTGATVAGSYRAHVRLTASDGQAFDAFADFTIVGEPRLEVAVATDRAAYGAGEIVQIRGTLRNTSRNLDLAALTGVTRLVDQSGAEVMRAETTVASLLLGTQVEIAARWPAAPGSYTARFSVRSGSDELGASTASFSVRGVERLEGRLAIVPGAVALGQQMSIAADVTNTGTLALAGALMRIVVLDPDTREPLQTFDRSADLPIGAHLSWTVSATSLGLRLRTYPVLLQAQASPLVTLASAAVTVLDSEAPSVHIASPAPGAFLNAPVDVTAFAADNASGVERVEFRIDQGPWQLLTPADPVTGRYSLAYPATPATEGVRTLIVRARDLAGNGDETSSSDVNPASVSFTIDVTPPQIAITGVDEGTTYHAAVTPTVTISDANAYTEVVLLNAAPFAPGTPIAQEGAYALTVSATDAAGNASTTTVNFAIRLNEPPTATTQTATTAEDVPIGITLTATDPNGGLLTFEAAPPASGALTGTPPNLIYTPNRDFNGSDSFTFTASDGTLSSAPALVSITIAPVNDLPVAVAGSNQSVIEGERVTLDGTGSSDPDGDALGYRWQHIAGPPVTLDTASQARPTFVAPPVMPEGDTLTFELVVRDGTADSAPAIVNVTVKNINHPPVAAAGPDQTVNEGSGVSLDGAASYDADDDRLSYAWVQTAGPPVDIVAANTAQPSFAARLIAVDRQRLTFQLTVGDGLATATDTLDIFVENVNHPPTANAGRNQSKNELSLVTLDGSGSADSDGDQLTYRWRQTSGPRVVLSNGSSATPSFSSPEVGSTGGALVFELIVNDGSRDSAPDSVTITILNVDQEPACRLATPSQAVLWPPDHKLVAVTIMGLTDSEDSCDDRRDDRDRVDDGHGRGSDDDDRSRGNSHAIAAVSSSSRHDRHPHVRIVITRVTQDEPVDGPGDGDTSPDAVIQGDTVLLRAERSGKGNGRVYRISFTAVSSSGARCSGSVVVGVPVSKKPDRPIVDDGQRYDSTKKK